MKNNLKIGASVVGLLAFAAPVFAADAVYTPPPQVYVPPAAPVAPAGFDWSGLYGGIEAGYGWGSLEGPALGGDIEANGALAGVFAGYNYDLGGYVLGAEADALWSGMSGTNGAGNTGDINWLGSARLRAGVDLGRILIYGTGGLAVGGVEVNGPGVAVSNTQVGWTAGGGADVAISDNMFLRGEYQYVDLGSDTFGAAGDVDTTAHTFRAGVGLRF